MADGAVAGVDAQFFAGGAVYALWQGFVDDGGGTIVSYRAALASTPDATTAPDVAPWRDVGLRYSAAFKSVDLVQGRTYYALVAAVDAVGHVGAVAVSSGQTYDGSPPVTHVGDVTQVAQKEPNTGAEWNTRYASQTGFVVVRCPRCSDDTSGIASGGCALGSPGPEAPLATRAFGSSWTNDAFVLGLPTPLTDATAYNVTCECYNGACVRVL